MFQKLMLASTMLILAYLFWLSSDFTEISAGIAIFLFGMIFIKKGFASFSGGFLEKLLQKATNRPYKGMIFGFFACNMLQSSTLVTILTIGFLSAEMIGLTQAIAIVFGSSVGTTTTAWFVAAVGLKVNIGAYAFPLIIFGMIWSMQKSKTLKGLGSVLAGIGFVFLGIHFIKEGFDAFQSMVSLRDYAVDGFPGLLLFTLIGIIVCILTQSSTATLVIVIAAVSLGEVTYENALAMVIGANIGTTITGIIASLSANVNGRRLAFADFSFKTTTAIVIIIFFPYVVGIIASIAGFLTIAPENYTLKVALFHTFFNVTGVMLLSPFISRIARIATRMLPDAKPGGFVEFQYISEESLSFPDTAHETLRKESHRLYSYSLFKFPNIFGLEKVFYSDGQLPQSGKYTILQTEEIDMIYERDIKVLYGKILSSLIETEIRHNDEIYDELQELKHANRNLVSLIKNIGNISPSMIRYLKSTNLSIRSEYETISSDILTALRLAYTIEFQDENIDKLEHVAKLERLIEEGDITKNTRYSKLVAEKHINQTMATTLLNDTYLKKLILQNIFELVRYHSLRELQKQVKDEDVTKKSNKWIQKFRKEPENKAEKIIEKLKQKETKISKKLSSKKLSPEDKKYFNEELKDIGYALKHYHDILEGHVSSEEEED
ncbi:Na/Pi symporter [Candidatus Gracilibacteria bacterium]|nr:Na/Pi symporter [Candidatus Gracilibacteria bacterium]